ncbi:hypothetical protein ACFL4N_04265 [Thermodesulfobacteriota bacterium]
MDDDTKKEIKKIARNTEVKIAQSILRWKYKKEGKGIPEDGNLQNQSRVVTDKANRIISQRGKNIWKELKKSYHRTKEDEKE